MSIPSLVYSKTALYQDTTQLVLPTSSSQNAEPAIGRLVLLLVTLLRRITKLVPSGCVLGSMKLLEISVHTKEEALTKGG